MKRNYFDSSIFRSSFFIVSIKNRGEFFTGVITKNYFEVLNWGPVFFTYDIYLGVLFMFLCVYMFLFIFMCGLKGFVNLMAGAYVISGGRS